MRQIARKCRECGKCDEHCRCADPVPLMKDILINLEECFDIQLQISEETAPHEYDKLSLIFRQRRSGQSLTLKGLNAEQLEAVALAFSKQPSAGDMRHSITEENLKSLSVQSLGLVLQEMPAERLREIIQAAEKCLKSLDSTTAH